VAKPLNHPPEGKREALPIAWECLRVRERAIAAKPLPIGKREALPIAWECLRVRERAIAAKPLPLVNAKPLTIPGKREALPIAWECLRVRERAIAAKPLPSPWECLRVRERKRILIVLALLTSSYVPLPVVEPLPVLSRWSSN